MTADAVMVADTLAFLVREGEDMVALDDGQAFRPRPDETEDDVHDRLTRQGIDALCDELPRLVAELTPQARYVLTMWAGAGGVVPDTLAALS